MNQDEAVLLLIKGAISDLTTEQKADVERIAAVLRSNIAEGGEMGPIAFALVGAEMQAGGAQ